MIEKLLTSSSFEDNLIGLNLIKDYSPEQIGSLEGIIRQHYFIKIRKSPNIHSVKDMVYRLNHIYAYIGPSQLVFFIDKNLIPGNWPIEDL